jgi:hypothetical protein
LEITCPKHVVATDEIKRDDIYITAVGLIPDGSSTSHIYTQTINVIQRKGNNTEKEILGSSGRAPSLRITRIPWHLPYN